VSRRRARPRAAPPAPATRQARTLPAFLREIATIKARWRRYLTMGVAETTVFPELDALGRELLHYLGATTLLSVARERQAASRGAGVEPR
jgi:hypothetical protein